MDRDFGQSVIVIAKVIMEEMSRLSILIEEEKDADTRKIFSTSLCRVVDCVFIDLLGPVIKDFPELDPFPEVRSSRLAERDPD